MGYHGQRLEFLVLAQRERDWRDSRSASWGGGLEPASAEMVGAARDIRRDVLDEFVEWYMREVDKQRAQMQVIEAYLLVNGCDLLPVADGCSLAVPRHVEVIGAHVEQAEALVGVFSLVVNEVSEKAPGTFLNVGDAFPRALAAVAAFLC